jgi:hypothetical protein
MSEEIATPLSGESGTSQSAKPREPDADSPVGDMWSRPAEWWRIEVERIGVRFDINTDEIGSGHE